MGEVCPDGEKNDQIWPAMAFGFPNPNPYGQERVLSFPYPPFSAIIRTNSRGIWGILVQGRTNTKVRSTSYVVSTP